MEEHTTVFLVEFVKDYLCINVVRKLKFDTEIYLSKNNTALIVGGVDIERC